MMKSFVSAYHKKYGRDPLYCSRQCSGVGRRKTSESGNTFVCLSCGKENPKRRKPGGRLYEQQKYCNHDCKVMAQSTKALERFESGDYGKHMKRNGYMWITIPTLGRTGRKHIMEHRYVMSKRLGRDLLAQETVHHINGDRSDNRLENLELFNSNHGPGQRVIDKLHFAAELFLLYPEIGRSIGYELHRVSHISDDSENPAAPQPPSDP